MLAFDTNLVVYAANADAPEQPAAAAFLASLADRRDVGVCELMLVEVYLILRSPRVLRRPLDAARAAAHCQAFRENPNWSLFDAAPVMPAVWTAAATPQSAARRIIDVRLALTLRHHGVTEFATANVKDFQRLGFARVWNPLTAAARG